MPQSDPIRWSMPQMLTLASRGLGKVDHLGVRGATLVSLEEIEAMACVLACLGLVGTPPGGPAPTTLINTHHKGDLE